MPKGRCTNFDEPCPKHVNEEIIDVPDGADFVCPECGRELMAVASDGGLKLGKVPPVAKIAVLVLLVGLLGFGAFSWLDFGDSGASASAAENTASESTAPADAPPAAFVEGEIEDRLPEGYVLTDQPMLDSASENDLVYRYRVALRTEQGGYAVPITDLELPASAPEPLRDHSEHLIVGERLPPGKAYDTDAAQLAYDPGQELEGIWQVQFERSGEEWRVADAAFELSDGPGASGSPDTAFLTRAELESFETEREAALAEYEARWEAAEQDIENFRGEAFRGVPPACTKDLGPLVEEVVRLTSECPEISNEAERNDCFVRRDRLNSEVGECETQNRLHKEGRARAKRAVADYRKKRMEAFRQELARQAEAHTTALTSAR